MFAVTAGLVSKSLLVNTKRNMMIILISWRKHSQTGLAEAFAECLHARGDERNYGAMPRRKTDHNEELIA